MVGLAAFLGDLYYILLMLICSCGTGANMSPTSTKYCNEVLSAIDSSIKPKTSICVRSEQQTPL